MARDSIPAVQVAVVSGGRITFSRAFGRIGFREGRAVTVETRFPMASVSKPVTATALMVLAARGAVDLDAPVNRYLPVKVATYVGDSARVTLRALASHSSGIARHDLYAYAGDPPIPSVDERIRRYGRVSRPAGSRYEYSNLNYNILARVIELRFGERFADALHGAVLQPLGMTHTTVGAPRSRAARDGVVRSYDAARRAMDFVEEESPGAGGLFSTAEDLARFCAPHVGAPLAGSRPVLGAEALAETRRGVVASASSETYGLGWRTEREILEAPFVFHTGSNGASSSIVMMFPARGLCVVAVANVATDLPGWIATDVARLHGIRRTINVRREGDVVPPDPFAVRPLRASDGYAGSWSGVLETDEGEIPVRVVIDDSARVTVQMRTGAPVTATGVRLDAGDLRASFDGDVAPARTYGRRYRLHLRVARHDGQLIGTVTAASVPGEKVITLSWFIRLLPAAR